MLSFKVNREEIYSVECNMAIYNPACCPLFRQLRYRNYDFHKSDIGKFHNIYFQFGIKTKDVLPIIRDYCSGCLLKHEYSQKCTLTY